jgi:pimeloyl-ACP methyl ester carboxylesterase
MLGDVLGALDRLGLDRVTLVGHSMGGGIAFRLASQHQDRVERLIIEDVAPPYPRSRPIPERPARPLPFDWAVVPAIIGHVNKGDPALWAALGEITAPTLLIGGGPQSHISQDKIAEAVARIPHCDLVTIPAGHNVHANRPGEFADAVLGWLAAGQSGGLAGHDGGLAGQGDGLAGGGGDSPAAGR